MPSLQARGQQAIAVNDFQINAIAQSHKLRSRTFVNRRDFRFDARIDRYNAGFFDDDLGLEITKRRKLVGHGIPFFLSRNNAHCLATADGNAHHFDGGTTTFLVAEGIIGKARRRCVCSDIAI